MPRVKPQQGTAPMPRSASRGNLSSRQDSTPRRRDRAKFPRKRRLLFETLENRRVLATITGQVVWDLNGDGIIAVDEPGLENRRVYIDQNNNNRYDDGEVFSLTDADGIYRLLDVPTGYHRVALDPQDGWQSTFPTGTGRWTVPVLLATQTIAGYDFAQLREFTPFQPGNLLISRASFSESDLLLEYTPDGQLVQAVVIPGSEGTSPVIARDLVLDSRGRVQIVNGYEDVRLMTFDPPRSADETLNVSEDFADGIADRFEVQSGVWSVQSGRYVAAPGSMLTGISTLTVSSVVPERMPPITPPRQSGPRSSAITVMVSSST